MKIITIHGIRAKRKWFRSLDTIDVFSEDAYHLLHFDYGYLSIIGFFLGFRRRGIYKKFVDFYAQHIRTNERPCAICHSFGTFVLFKAIQLYPEIRFDRIILFGSILNPETDLSIFFKNDQVREILHEVGRKDRVVKYSSRILGNQSGNSGEIGFRDIPSKYFHRVKQVQYADWEHSSAAFHLHMRETWIKFLTAPRFTFKTGILRDDIIKWAHCLDIDPSLIYERADFNARVDSQGNYYGRYLFEGINKSQNHISFVPVCVTGDSTDTLQQMAFAAYDGNYRKLSVEIIADNHHLKHVCIHFLSSIQPGERFCYSYNFKFSNTMLYTGDTDTFRIFGCKRVSITVNTFYRLSSPCFFALLNRTIIARFEPQVQTEKDGTFTYSLNFDNSQSCYEVIFFYYEGHHSESRRKSRGLSYQQTMSGITIRKAIPEDIKTIYAIEAQIERSNAACEAVLQERQRMFGDGFLVAIYEEKIVGYIESLIWNSMLFCSFADICDFPIHHTIHGNSLYIIFMAVHPQFRHKGIATALLNAIEQICCYYGIDELILVAKNELEGFYSRRGYSRKKELPYFLDSDEKPSIVMTKYLTSASTGRE